MLSIYKSATTSKTASHRLPISAGIENDDDITNPKRLAFLRRVVIFN